jgi:hypothetical protein
MWKIAEVVPLHKEGDPEIGSNNRPISLLSCLSKICDKVALNQYTEHLTNHRLLTEHQSGNRKKHSTETLNIAVTDMLLEAMDNKQLSIVILLDMSKAFDSADHNMLLRRILNLGVSSAVHKWFKVTCMTDSSMLELELPLRRLLHCRTEFLQALFYRRFYLIYAQIACLQFPTVVILDRMLTIRKHFIVFIVAYGTIVTAYRRGSTQNF